MMQADRTGADISDGENEETLKPVRASFPEIEGHEAVKGVLSDDNEASTKQSKSPHSKHLKYNSEFQQFIENEDSKHYQSMIH